MSTTAETPHHKLKLLLIEDNDADARLVHEIVLARAAGTFEVERVSRLKEGLERLGLGGIDAVVLDLGLPDSHGVESVSKLHAQAPNVSIVVLSGTDDEALAVDALHRGAQDYLVKGQVSAVVFVHSVRYAVERQRMEEALAHERDLLAALLDKIPDRIYFKDRKSRFVRIGRAVAAQFGLTDPAQAAGKTDFDFFTAEHAQPAFDDEQQIMRSGEPLVGKVEKETLSDGSVTWALTTKMPLRDHHGRIIGTFGISKDMTDLHTVEEALATERNLLRSLLDNLPDLVYIKDTESRYLLNNSAHLAFLGAPDQQAVTGKTAADFLDLPVATKAHTDDRRVFQTGQPLINHEEVSMDYTGRQYWLLTTRVPLRDSDGRVTGLVGISRDITRRKQAEENAARYARLLRDKNAEMEGELNLAREVQVAFLPQRYPTFPRNADADESALKFVHRYLPAGMLGGDFFDVRALSDSRVGVLVCDVMGHGVRAALEMAILRALVEELSPHAGEPSRFLEAMNHELWSILRHREAASFATAFYLVADVATGRICCANAGHPGPLRVRRGPGRDFQVQTAACATGPALGLLADSTYGQSDHDLAPGDLILLFTDGLYEIENAGGESFGRERLLAAVQRRAQLAPAALCDELLVEIQQFAGSREFPDDVCVVGMEVARLLADAAKPK
ncbi:MAG: SpoIIE family protein phosphatase [Verrucomicrobia bacterium]|nr:SpoIIE family protein phosphatase [Verrucomicrobiota bacterium]